MNTIANRNPTKLRNTADAELPMFTIQKLEVGRNPTLLSQIALSRPGCALYGHIQILQFLFYLGAAGKLSYPVLDNLSFRFYMEKISNGAVPALQVISRNSRSRPSPPCPSNRRPVSHFPPCLASGQLIRVPPAIGRSLFLPPCISASRKGVPPT